MKKTNDEIREMALDAGRKFAKYIYIDKLKEPIRTARIVSYEDGWGDGYREAQKREIIISQERAVDKLSKLQKQEVQKAREEVWDILYNHYLRNQSLGFTWIFEIANALDINNSRFDVVNAEKDRSDKNDKNK